MAGNFFLGVFSDKEEKVEKNFFLAGKFWKFLAGKKLVPKLPSWPKKMDCSLTNQSSCSSDVINCQSVGNINFSLSVATPSIYLFYYYYFFFYIFFIIILLLLLFILYFYYFYYIFIFLLFFISYLYCYNFLFFLFLLFLFFDLL